MSSKGTVCVIGAGAAGLVSAKVLRDDGFDVTVFEKNDGIGGVWHPDFTYPSLGTQSLPHLYSYSDYPCDASEAPAAETLKYFQTYADRSRVTPLIHFKIEVTNCRLVQDNKWEVSMKDITSGLESLHVFDFLCVCSGAFGIPLIPKFPDQEKFTGEIVHTKYLKSEKTVQDKRVAVIGMGKSALDCSTLAGQIASKAYLIFQKPYLMGFRRMAKGKLDRKFLFGRLFEYMLPPHYRVSTWDHRLFHWLAPNFIKKFWTNTRFGMKMCYGLPAGHPLFPTDEDVTKPLYWAAGLSPLKFPDLVRAGKIECIKASIKRFLGGSTVELNTGERLDLDVLILATGYSLKFPFFDEYLKKKMGLPYQLGADSNPDFELYRQVFPMEVPNIAFNGYRVTLVTIKSFEVTAHYISDYFQNRLVNLPKTLEGRKVEQNREKRFLRSMGNREFIHWSPYNQLAVDVLIDEMGLPIARTKWFWTEYILPLPAYGYANLGQQRRDRDAGKFIFQPYIGFTHIVFAIWALFIALIYFLFFF